MSAEMYDTWAPVFPPLIDHPHERLHQHHSLLQTLTRRAARPQDYPNYPDTDIRDAGTEYWIEIECPGIKDVSDVSCQWTSTSTLVVTGSIPRPGEKSESEAVSGVEGDKEKSGGGPPFLLVGERKVGYFRRIFNLPTTSEMEKVQATLEAGLLRLIVPKVAAQRKEKVGGKVEVRLAD